MNQFVFLSQIFAVIAIYAIAVYIHDYGRLDLVEVHWKSRDQEHETIQYSRPLDELDLFLLVAPIICFVGTLFLILVDALSRNKKLMATIVRILYPWCKNKTKLQWPNSNSMSFFVQKGISRSFDRGTHTDHCIWCSLELFWVS